MKDAPMVDDTVLHDIVNTVAEADQGPAVDDNDLGDGDDDGGFGDGDGGGGDD